MFRKILFAVSILAMSFAAFSVDKIEVKLLDKNGAAATQLPVLLQVAGTKTEWVFEGFPHTEEVRRVVWQKVWMTNREGKAQIDLKRVQIGSDLENVTAEIKIALVGTDGNTTQEIGVGAVLSSVGFVFKNSSPKFAPLIFSLSRAPRNVEARALEMNNEELAQDVLDAIARLEDNKLPIPYAK